MVVYESYQTRIPVGPAYSPSSASLPLISSPLPSLYPPILESLLRVLPAELKRLALEATEGYDGCWVDSEGEAEDMPSEEWIQNSYQQQLKLHDGHRYIDERG